MEEETGGYPPERNKRNDVSELLLIEQSFDDEFERDDDKDFKDKWSHLLHE